MLIKKLLAVAPSEATFHRRGFVCLNMSAVSHLEEIGAFFLKGYHLALERNEQNRLIPALNTIQPFYRGFAFEGAAMSLTLQDFLSLFNKHRIRNLASTEEGGKHIYMLYVGIGWAYARLPFNIERRIKKFDSLLRWLIVDGYGFHQAYFKTKKYVEQMRLPRCLKSHFAKKVFYQGVGRCLWFIDCASSERISNRISKFPEEFRADLWSGVGLACTYAGGASESDIKELKVLSKGYLPHLAQGAVFAAKARLRAGLVSSENEIACKHICSMPVKDAALLADNCLAQIPSDLSSIQQYEWWRQAIRTSISKVNHHETIL